MLNVITLIGRLCSDPELKYTPSGKAVCNFRLAVDRNRKDESGEKQTDFIDIVCWQQSAEFAANYLSKGRLAAVTGRLQIREWTDKEGGKRKSAEVVASEVRGLDKPKEKAAAEGEAPDNDPFA